MTSTAKILLINPRRGWRPPLGLLYVAGYLRRAGRRVKVVEFLDEAFFPEADAPRWREIEAFDPDVIGLGVISWNRAVALAFIERLRRTWPDKKIVCGGKDPTFQPEVYLRRAGADFVVLHEGEETMLELVEALETGRDVRRIAGLAYREGGEVKATPGRPPVSLEKIPYPALDLVDYDGYCDIRLGGIPGHFLRTGFLMANRGCPYRCRFCTDPVRAVYRERPVDDIVGEIRWQMDRWKIEGLVLLDDLFYFREDRVREFCERVLRERISLKFYGQTRADRAARDRGTLALMRQAGFIQIGLGVESGSQRMLNLMDKRVGLSRVRAALEKIRAAGIMSYAFLIVGLPEETEEDLASTARFLRETRPTFVTVNYFMPMPGTDYFRAGGAGEHEAPSFSLSELPPSFPSKVPRRTILRYRRRFLALGRRRADWNLLTYPLFWGWIAGVLLFKPGLIWRALVGRRKRGASAGPFEAVRTALINERIGRTGRTTVPGKNGAVRSESPSGGRAGRSFPRPRPRAAAGKAA